MPNWELLPIVIAAIAIGHWLGRRANNSRSDGAFNQDQYIRGLNLLLDEQPDEAIDTFIDALDVNARTLETHLALGNLVRRRGEVARAIKIHQNLLGRPGLNPEQLQQVQLELARDYIRSGLLDRAESLLQELVPAATPEIRLTALRHLIEIYRDEKEWAKAIDCVQQLAGRRFGRMDEQWLPVQAQFYCELAQQVLASGELLQARRYARAALDADKNCVRANLIRADIDTRQGQYREALAALTAIPQQDAELIPEMLPALVQVYEQMDQLPELTHYLQALYSQYPGASLLILLARRIGLEQGLTAALTLLEAEVARRPSVRVMEYWLALRPDAQSGPAAVAGLESVHSLLARIHQTRPSHRCNRCGFSGQQLHWLCPGCKTWGSVKPIKGAEGE